MRNRIIAALACALVAAAAPAFGAEAFEPDPVRWRALDPESTLYIDTDHGRIVVELYPEIAPRHVDRIKELARERFYDGLSFHRVIDGFMAQGGDPNGDGTGGSSKPDLQQEFEFRRDGSIPFVEARRPDGGREGFHKALPIFTQPDEQMFATRDKRVAAWGLHCPGIASMARAQEPNSANSQFFLMLASRPRLDRQYTIWGRVVWGQDALNKIAKGEPPPRPDVMRAVRVAADLAKEEQAPIYIMRTDSPDFRKLIDDVGKKRGRDFSTCDVVVPVRVRGEAAPRRGRDARVAEEKRPWWRAIPLVP